MRCRCPSVSPPPYSSTYLTPVSIFIPALIFPLAFGILISNCAHQKIIWYPPGGVPAALNRAKADTCVEYPRLFGRSM